MILELTRNKSFYREYVTGNFENHLENIKHMDGSIRSWATESEIFAAAFRYDIDIFVHLENSKGNSWHKYPIGDCNHLKDFITISYKSNHFNIIESNKRPCGCNNISATSDSSESKTNEATEIVENVMESETAVGHTNSDIECGRELQFAREDNVKEVVNLSSKRLSQPQLSILQKGLKFVPTKTDIDFSKLLTDLQLWERRMRLKEYFYDTDDNSEAVEKGDKFKLKKKITWTPREGRDKWLDQYIKEVKDDIIRGLRRDFSKNITRSEEEAIRQLFHDNSIVIRPADKGSGIVIMDAETYTDQLEKEMFESKSYEEVKEDMSVKISNKIKKLVNGMHKNGSITSEVKKYLWPSEIQPGKLQANPKIHKKIHKKEFPIRTIVNGRNHPTEKMAELVESQLEENVKSLPSYIQDTTDFLNKISTIQQPLPDNTLIFCMDVKGLYPNVPRQQAKIAVTKALEKRKNHLIPTTDVIYMMDTVLQNNNFSFNGRHYLQKEGTAIGSRLGMNYACTYLGEWETELLQNCSKSPFSYYRYVDDIWGLWTGGIDELLFFQSEANSIHPNIQVELRYATERIEFLDVLVSIKDNFLTTDLYSKPSDKHLYLHNTSCHPESTKRAIPYGLGVRIKRICSDEKQYKKRREVVCSQLSKRGYKSDIVESQLRRVDNKCRADLLKYKNKTSNIDRVPLVLTFNSALPNVSKILQKRHKTLQNSDKLKNVFPNTSILSFRRDTNLQDILIHKKHNNMFFRKPNKSEPCGKNCALCPYLQDTDKFHDTNGKQYSVRNYINCKSVNVVYAIFCIKCDKIVYVGETGDTLYQRQI